MKEQKVERVARKNIQNDERPNVRSVHLIYDNSSNHEIKPFGSYDITLQEKYIVLNYYYMAHNLSNEPG